MTPIFAVRGGETSNIDDEKKVAEGVEGSAGWDTGDAEGYRIFAGDFVDGLKQQKKVRKMVKSPPVWDSG